jgi:glucosylceramidase
MKHFSHFVQPGAKRVDTQGTFDNALAFINPDQSIVVVLRNQSGSEKTVSVTAGTKRARISMDADSINTLLLSREA